MCSLVRVLGQQLEQVAGQPRGGLHTAVEEHHHQPAHLRRWRDLLRRERDTVDVTANEVGDQVVAAVPAALLQQVDEVLLHPGGGRPWLPGSDAA